MSVLFASSTMNSQRHRTREHIWHSCAAGGRAADNPPHAQDKGPPSDYFKF